MDHLRTQELPEKLYRVQYDRSQSTFSYATLGADLQAKDTTAFYGLLQLGSIKTAVQNQFEWGHRGSQPFITVFSDKEYAMAWALLAPWNSNQKGSSYFELYTIDTTHLGPDTYVFKLSTLVEYLDVTLPVGPANHVKGGYLFLHRVPGSALVERQTREEIAEGTI